jgi:hypothetical protein
MVSTTPIGHESTVIGNSKQQIPWVICHRLWKYFSTYISDLGKIFEKKKTDLKNLLVLSKTLGKRKGVKVIFLGQYFSECIPYRSHHPAAKDSVLYPSPTPTEMGRREERDGT